MRMLGQELGQGPRWELRPFDLRTAPAFKMSEANSGERQIIFLALAMLLDKIEAIHTCLNV